MEVGGGAYILRRSGKHVLGLEGRYGRKVTDGMSLFALAFSFMKNVFAGTSLRRSLFL